MKQFVSSSSSFYAFIVSFPSLNTFLLFTMDFHPIDSMLKINIFMKDYFPFYFPQSIVHFLLIVYQQIVHFVTNFTLKIKLKAIMQNIRCNNALWNIFNACGLNQLKSSPSTIDSKPNALHTATYLMKIQRNWIISSLISNLKQIRIICHTDALLNVILTNDDKSPSINRIVCQNATSYKSSKHILYYFITEKHSICFYYKRYLNKR